jgi:hypothetical protein
MVIFNAASDDTYSGGGGPSDNPGIQAINTFTLAAATPNVPPDLWSRNYSGIYRVNVMLGELPFRSGADCRSVDPVYGGDAFSAGLLLFRPGEGIR